MVDGVHLDDLAGLGSEGLTLSDGDLTLGFGGCLDSVVILDTLEESFVTTRLADVLDANVNTLAKDAATNKLVHLDTDSDLVNVEYYAGPTVVILVRHTLVYGGISVNINVVTLLEDLEVTTDVGHTLCSEGLGELLSSL